MSFQKLPQLPNSYINIQQVYKLPSNKNINEIIQLKIVSDGKIKQLSKKLTLTKFECHDVESNTSTLTIWNDDINKYNKIIKKDKIVQIFKFYYNDKYKSINIHNKSVIKNISHFIMCKNNKLFVVEPKLTFNPKLNQPSITNYFRYKTK